MISLRGLPVSPGVAIGPARALDPLGRTLPDRPIPAEDVQAQLDRLDNALEAARDEAQHACDEARRRLGSQYGDILAAHARMIADPTLRAEARTRIVRDRIAPEHAVVDVLEGYAARLEQLSDSHLASRAADIRDILHRILERLRQPAGPQVEDGQADAPPSLILAHDLSPSATAGLDTATVLGFATEVGGQASHTAIVAAALEIPAVVGVGRFLERARQARWAVIDGDEGLVILDPDAATLRRYRKASKDRAARFAGLVGLAGLPAETRDGTAIRLQGNIEFPTEVAGCLQWGAEGVGLYRTEFLYLGSGRAPGEQEQYEAYAGVVRPLQGRPVVIRTLDLGADKLPDSMARHRDDRNPALGLRSIRLSLREPDAFRVQLRAILRAGALGDVRMLLPLVSTLGEWRRVRALVAQVAAELAAEGIPFREVPLGAMIEVPAAALMADHLAREVDFFSIGTNDLVQYTLAVDRTNETVADLYSPADPSVLRLIARVMDAARHEGKPVNVCGSMGGEPLFTALLIGMGLRELSMPPHQILEVKRVVRALHLDQAQALARDILELDSAETIAERLRAALAATHAAAPHPREISGPKP
ncbi:MAG: phosphoenolpyruvate--protein phosphotransferase [Isosphaeraceae bacterium]